MIEFSDVSLNIGGNVILNKVNWRINEGEFWLVIGPNGAGKTSLLSILMGFVSDFSGTVRINGRQIGSFKRKELATRLAFLPQFDEIPLPFLTVQDILKAGRYPYVGPFQSFSETDRQAIERSVTRFGLQELLNRDITSLSGGEKKKVYLGSALVQDVSTIVLDEPMTFLDPESKINILKDLGDFQGKGKTIVVVTHHVDLAFPYIQNILALKKGEVIYCGQKPEDLGVLKEVYQVSFSRLMKQGKEIIYIDE